VSDSPRLTFYSRAYCHLCDDMLAARDSLRGELVFEVQVPNRLLKFAADKMPLV